MQEEIKQKIVASIKVQGYDCAPDEITKSFGVEPTEAVKKGDVWRVDPSGQQPPVLYKDNLWVLRSELPVNAEAKEHLQALLSKIRPRSKSIADIARRYSTELSLGGYIFDSQVGVHIDRDLLREVADMNMSLDVDIYSLNKDYLDTKEKVDQLANILSQLKAVKSKSSPRHDEARAIAEALAVFEKHSETIRDALVSDLFWTALDEEDLDKRLVELAKRTAIIQQSMNKSKILVPQNKRSIA